MGINRIRLQNGATGDPRVDARMQQTYQENIRRNNAERTINQMSRDYDFSGLSSLGLNPKTYDSTPGPMRGLPAVGDSRERLIRDIMNRNQPYSLTPPKPPEPTDPLTGMPEAMMLPNMADGSMRSLAQEDAIRNKVLAAQQAQEKQYYLTDPISGKQYKSEQEAINDLGIVTYNQRFASGGRVGFQDGTDPNLTARQVAEQNPELDATRRQLFGENYLQDIDQGTGIAQYYTGFGQMPTLDYTPPVVEEAAPAVDVTQPIVDTGGGGGGGSDIDNTTPDTGNTEFEQGLIDQGVGVQGAIGDPVVAPGEMLSTQAEMDAYNAPAVLDSTSTAEEIAQDLSNQQAMLNPTGGNIMDEVALTGEITPMDVREQYGTQGQYEGYVNPADVEAGLATESMFDTPEQTKSIGDAFNSVKDLGEAGIGKLRGSLVALGGKVKEGFDNVIEIGGKTIDLGKSLALGALSFATGIPGIGFALDAIKEDPVDTYNQSLFSADNYLDSDMYKVDKDMTDQEYSEYKNRLGSYYGDLRAGNIEGQDPFGKNITSAFGDYEAMAQDIVDKVSSIPVDERSQFEKDQLDFYGDVVKDTPAPQEDIGATDTMASINMQEAKDITDRLDDEITDGSDLRGDPYGGGQTGVQSGMNTPTNDFAGQGDPYGGGQTGVQSGMNTPTNDFAGQGTGGDGPAGGASNAAANEAAAAANEAAASNREAARTGQYDSGGGGGGGGSSGGGGKIVCTMMNNSYGFGSFRNKIWLKHSKDMKPEYQIGYHKIFLPLVKLSKTNKVLKKTLEHIAVHRTIDIRQEARGKVHLLGRVYRKIFEPICYVVGKYVK